PRHGRRAAALPADRRHELGGAAVGALGDHPPDRLGGLLGGDRAEEAAVLPGALGEDEGLRLERGLPRLRLLDAGDRTLAAGRTDLVELTLTALEIGRASCRERVVR